VTRLLLRPLNDEFGDLARRCQRHLTSLSAHRLIEILHVVQLLCILVHTGEWVAYRWDPVLAPRQHLSSLSHWAPTAPSRQCLLLAATTLSPRCSHLPPHSRLPSLPHNYCHLTVAISWWIHRFTTPMCRYSPSTLASCPASLPLSSRRVAKINFKYSYYCSPYIITY
jgi:hypothetical protein